MLKGEKHYFQIKRQNLGDSMWKLHPLSPPLTGTTYLWSAPVALGPLEAARSNILSLENNGQHMAKAGHPHIHVNCHSPHLPSAKRFPG